MTQYNDTSGLSQQIRDLYQQIRQLQTQPRLTSSSIDRGGTQSSDYDGSDIDTPGTVGWKIGTDEDTGVGYVHINGKTYTNTDTAWTQISTYQPNWSGFTGSGWTGMWYRRIDNIVYVAGALTKAGAPGAGEHAFTMPVGFRPSQQTLGYASTGLWPTIATTGTVFVAAGTVPSAMAFSYPI